MSDTEKINQQNHAYWTDRASGYSEVNQEELAGIQKKTWSDLLDREIRDHFKIGETHRSRIRILDIGAGPGFLSVILCEQGYQVTAADYAETMLEEAKQNAGTLAEKICFRREDAMNLSFPKATFDVVLSRNLTWNLPDPQRAYEEWLRVLKHNGKYIVCAAYANLRDDESRPNDCPYKENKADACKVASEMRTAFTQNIKTRSVSGADAPSAEVPAFLPVLLCHGGALRTDGGPGHGCGPGLPDGFLLHAHPWLHRRLPAERLRREPVFPDLYRPGGLRAVRQGDERQNRRSPAPLQDRI